LPRLRVRISKSDVDLAASAKVAAGGALKLAQTLGVSKQAASEWGRVRPIPRHARPRLEQLVRQRASLGSESVERSLEETPWQSLGALVAGTDLRLAPPRDERRSRDARGAWHGMTEEHRTALGNKVRQAALIAIAIQQLLPDDSARRVVATLSTQVSAHVNTELLRFAR